MPIDGITNDAVARAAWGKAAPEWVLVLAECCDKAGQTTVAKRLNISKTVVSLMLKKAYTGRVDLFEQRVRGELMNETVACPVLAEITKRRCMDEQARPYAATNAVRIELHRACPRCPNRMGAKEPS